VREQREIGLADLDGSDDADASVVDDVP
jgi:hypothetical protein